MDDADEIYSKNLALVLDFFASKLHLYYSSSRLTLLLTVLSDSAPYYLPTDIIPFPSRLKITDGGALVLHTTLSWYGDECHWKIFQDFLNSNDPLALDERRYAVAALACLKILLGRSQPPISHITWFSQHSQALRKCIPNHSQRSHKALQLGRDRRRVAFYWHVRTRHHNQMPQKQPLYYPSFQFEQKSAFSQFEQESGDQTHLSNHLRFLLSKSAYSHNIFNFARYRVFRFGYLRRNHPTYMKRAIFALAKYIERVTGETAEVKACESIWGRYKWFVAQ